MATKDVKKVAPKGQRLGWTPMKDVKHIIVSAVTVRGRRVVIKNVQETVPADSLLIP